MPISVLLALIAGISCASYFFLRPLQCFSNKAWLISHGVIFASLGFILGWLWLNRSAFEHITMLMGGIWTLTSGLCFVMVYALRKHD